MTLQCSRKLLVSQSFSLLKMKTVSIIDTTISSYNLGNEIIMDSVNSIVEELFPETFLFRIPWEEKFSRKSLRYMASSDFTFFGGTNAFSSHLLRYKQHGFRLKDLITFRDLTSFGMGWWQYQSKPDFYSAFFWRSLLSASSIHSVRDEYTKKMLESIGINNVVNTSCPTTWSLTESHCESIPNSKSENVVTTLTDYNPSLPVDKKMIDILFDNYKTVSIWIQGRNDIERFEKIFSDYPDLRVIPPKLSLYDAFLENTECDYIGTRLHAGIRALQRGRRALIVAVDNRALEISKDINLNVVSRGSFDPIINFIDSNFNTTINLPLENIYAWKNQFF